MIRITGLGGRETTKIIMGEKSESKRGKSWTGRTNRKAKEDRVKDQVYHKSSHGVRGVTDATGQAGTGITRCRWSLDELTH